MATLGILDYKKEYTVADYLLLGDDSRCQLINGEFVMSPSPSSYHQDISANLNEILRGYARKILAKVFYAPIDVYFDSINVFQPDLVFLKIENLNKISERGIEGAPDVVVEILSPSNSHIDRYRKREAYMKFGVKEYWIIDPAYQSLEIHHFKTWQNEPVFYLSGAGMVTSLELEMLEFDLKILWER